METQSNLGSKARIKRTEKLVNMIDDIDCVTAGLTQRQENLELDQEQLIRDSAVTLPHNNNSNSNSNNNRTTTWIQTMRHTWP